MQVAGQIAGQDAARSRPQDYRYRAFLSYSRADQKVVDDMFRRLNAYRTPSALVKETGDFGAPPRSIPLFLDRKSAQLGATVPDRLRKAVVESAFLVLFCSEASARSEWVRKEVEIFLETHPAHHVLPVFLRKSLQQQPVELMPQPLIALGAGVPIGADLLADGGPEPVSHKLLGAMLGFPQDRISREQERADRRRRTIERTAMGTIAALSIGAAVAGWRAAIESQRAADSLEVSLQSLDATTPFMGSLLRSGRVRTAELEGYAANLSKLSHSMTDKDLKNLDDLRLGFGDVLTNTAAFHGVTGDVSARLADAERAYGLMKTFEFDPGPGAQLLICDAALQTAAARGALGDYPGAVVAAGDCDRVATNELQYQGADADATMQLQDKRLAAVRMQAQLRRSQSRFADALRTGEKAASIDYLGALTASAAAGDGVAERARRGVELDRAATLEAMGRYEEASAAYNALAAPGAAAQPGDDLAVDAEIGAVRAAGMIGDQHEAALARLAPLIAGIETETARDPSLRSELQLLAELATLRASILSDAPDASDASDTAAAPKLAGPANALAASAEYARAGDIMAALLAFDPANRAWRMQEASRLAMFADFLFRQWERDGEASLVCAATCLADARIRLETALDLLKNIRPSEPALVYLQADATTRLARVLREAGLNGAEARLDEVGGYLAELTRTAHEDRGVRVLEGNLADEKADNLLAAGDVGGAVTAWRKTMAIQDELLQEEPDWVAIRRDAIWTRMKIADALAETPDTSGARQAYADACAAAASASAIRSALILRDTATLKTHAARAGFACE